MTERVYIERILVLFQYMREEKFERSPNLLDLPILKGILF